MLRVIPVTDRGEIMLEEYQALLGPRTRLVALTHASNSLGTVLPVEEMTQMAHRYGARVLIDGAQTVAHVPVNVQQLGCDFFVFSGHKIFAPTGIGAVYAKRELWEIMPPWQGGGNMIRTVTFEETTFADPPAKFEAGTPNIADAVGLRADWSTWNAWACRTSPSTNRNCCNTRPNCSSESKGSGSSAPREKKWPSCRSSCRTDAPRMSAAYWTSRELPCGPATIALSPRCAASDWMLPSVRPWLSTIRRTKSISWRVPSIASSTLSITLSFCNLQLPSAKEECHARGGRRES